MKKLLALILIASACITARAQSVSGQIKDEGGDVLVGAAVQSGTKGVFTDVSGKFKLELPAGTHTLTITYTGYESQSKSITLVAGQELVLDLVMKSESTDLNDVVVVCYGVQRKRDVTGSIETVTGKQLTQFPVPS
ncbi:MAG: carboxypeptidase-like regulatory domain-containing protein, partial [Flavobacteriales bacterium]|nr:carboxypeptidase-like regulatory domain-containing protein [Flavobacteriales bacterium]